MNANMKVNIAGVEFKNPVTTASGTFGSGREYSEFIDLNKLGAITVKGVSINPCLGNPTPRIAETYGGMLNCIGLQNPGVEEFIKKDIPFIRQYDTKLIVNIWGKTIEEYIAVAERLASEDVDLLELNISCPNIKAGGISFGSDVNMVSKVVSEVKKVAKQPLIVKLSPNVNDIVNIAKTAQEYGADALSLINTLIGMKIDTKTRTVTLSNKIGGLSGPAIKPVAVRMIYQVYSVVNIPIIGMGGITNGDDAMEMILAGASMVAVGTANFMNPMATIEVLRGIEEYIEKYNFNDINKLIGIANKKEEF